MDAKFGFDDNADFRQKDIFKLRDVTQEDPQEVEAAEVRLLRVSHHYPGHSAPVSTPSTILPVCVPTDIGSTASTSSS